MSEGNADEMKKQAVLTISDNDRNVDVQLKNAKKLPRDFSSILSKLAMQYGVVFESAELARPTRHQVKSIQIT